MTSPHDPTSVRRLGARGGVALVLVAATAIVLLYGASGLFAALITPGADPAHSADARDREVQAYSTALDGHKAQFDGRSILFVPGPPPPPPPPPAATVESEPPPPPPPPSAYGGPKLIGMVNGVAWFEDGLRLAPGEEKRGVRVKRLNPPWDAEIEWEGVTFTVSLFARDGLISPPKKQQATRSEPEPPKQEPEEDPGEAAAPVPEASPPPPPPNPGT